MFSQAGMVLISVLTLNIWGLPGAGSLGLAPFREQRIQGICQELKKAATRPEGWDAVMLQEVWLKRDRRKLSRCGYRYVVDLNLSGKLIDSGLLILSKHPLKEAHRLTYPALPVGSEVFEDGEALAAKSANLVTMVHPGAGEVVIANTHLVSYYAEGIADKYQRIRLEQFIAFVDWTKKRAGNLPLILGGDFNFGPENRELWDEKNRRLENFVVSKQSEEVTTLSANNSFQEEDQDRVDHLLASPHFESRFGMLAMEKRIGAEGTDINLSDHFGWTEVFEIEAQPQ
ncbi:MAG: hypothetical protein EBZ49_12440 [Proteobacteria bacterium]|nr:hypothetical protein [Pseudomonadota bacterium]